MSTPAQKNPTPTPSPVASTTPATRDSDANTGGTAQSGAPVAPDNTVPVPLAEGTAPVGPGPGGFDTMFVQRVVMPGSRRESWSVLGEDGAPSDRSSGTWRA